MDCDRLSIKIPDRTGQGAYEFILEENRDDSSKFLVYYLNVTEWHPFTHFHMSIESEDMKNSETVREMEQQPKIIESFDKKKGKWLKDEKLEAEVVKLKEKLRFLNEFFKKNADYLFENKIIQDFIIEHEEFDEVEKLCQV